MEYSHLFVCLMGMGIVFFGLICIVALISVMGAVCRPKETRTQTEAQPAAVSAAPAAAGTAVGPEMMAAVSVAVAEFSGSDAAGIRIKSIKRL